ncbi:SDR family NAD(P)-dependent oxidoreductase [Pedobacter sp. ISL-68]|uniref:SDR family oxidoreductase n=1 Tax=unclassified Pedobacter TaxID=2628915 RepID=UPI001BE5CAFF|nr:MULTISPECIES: SDR family NAD(P)-dependent oxidoreductase [unclassified Pedobacter]MBT2560187.1 SDR family NAD(P)-dependent oxidoreductase [Pedobacter sp. ISL-64]MBT2589166.1 SDR family NAD(P)-dependent oxidoreductase [Pedobacter sp. ISL-68]
MNTSGNTIFISGGSAGIGLAIAKKLSAAGNNIIINGRNEERLQTALKELENTIAIQGDLSDKTDRMRITKELNEKYPEVNIIVNNAGIAFLNDLVDPTLNSSEIAAKEMNTNYVAVIDFTELMLPQLLKQESAAIINITSIAAFRGNPYGPTYAASKAALHNYTEGLRDKLAENENVKVFEVFPPLVNTQFSAAIGGANGIPPAEVADELFIAIEKSQFEVPVGETKKYHSAIQEAFIKINN